MNDNINLSKFKYLGSGHSGSVYLMPNGKCIKVCHKSKSCKHEYEIYKKVEGSCHFPKAYKVTSQYLIRDYVGGRCVINYIKKNGMSKTLARNLIELINDFKSLGFTRLDMRLPHIFVQKDMSIMVIDPRCTYSRKVPYPYHMIKGLKRLGVLKSFLNVLKSEYPDLYNKWCGKH